MKSRTTFGRSMSFLGLRVELACCCALSQSFVSACSWWRYDDVLENSPVEIIQAPADTAGLGKSLAVLRKQSSTLALVKADDEFAVYEFNPSNLESNQAMSQIGCRPSESCWLGNSFAPFARIGDDSSRVECAAFGVQRAENEAARIALWCADGQQRTLPMTEGLPEELAGLRANVANPGLVFASGPRLGSTLLAVASPKSGTTWIYDLGQDLPTSIAKPSTAGSSYATALAVAVSERARLVAVAEPSVSTVYVYLLETTNVVRQSYCIQGEAELGSALAAGSFTAEGSLDLAVLGRNGLIVIPALDSLNPPNAPTSCVSLAELTDVRSLSCGALNGGKACNELLTSAALSSANLDGTGPDEVLVGAPNAGVRGNDAAGKVLLASFAKAKAALLGELSASSGESGDRLGTSIVGVPLSGRDVVLAGAPGGNKLAAFFCTGLIAKGKGGARCD